FHGSVGTVTPWHLLHDRSSWHVAHKSRSLAARTPCSRTKSPSCTTWLSGITFSAETSTWQPSHLRTSHSCWCSWQPKHVAILGSSRVAVALPAFWWHLVQSPPA